MIETIKFYFQYDFVWYALIVGVLISLCASLLGVTLVLKRFSFIGDGLSHVAFLAATLAAIFKMTNKFWLAFPITIICAILLLCKGQNTKVKGDAQIAMISVGTLAIGYLVINLFGSSANVSGDVCGILFGGTSILTLSKAEVNICIIMSIVTVLVFTVFYNKIFSITFDENFATATGVNTKIYNLILATLIAVVIVLSMELVGGLLISALIIFPALSAMSLFNTFKSVTIFSVIISIFCAVCGILVSIIFGTPVGSTIVGIDIVMFGICSVIGLIKKGI